MASVLRLITRLFHRKQWRRLAYLVTFIVAFSIIARSLTQHQSTPLPWILPDSDMDEPIPPVVVDAVAIQSSNPHNEPAESAAAVTLIAAGSQSNSAVGSNDLSRNAPVPDASLSATSSLICDAECQRFRSLLDVWSPDKPKAAIILLIQRKSIPVFGRSVKLFDANFNDQFHYPIILFHEDNMADVDTRQQLQSMTNSSLFFQLVRFDVPDFINRSAVPAHVCFKSIGYRHMCRFQAKTLYDQPILAGLQFVWRLDDDSYILKPVGYDVVRLMRDKKIQYGFSTVVSDYGPCIVGLWSAVANYTRTKNIKPKFRWPRGRIYWNNFEISELAVWRSAEYRDYIDYIDRQGGIYYHRWGDATIKTIAVTLFVPKDQTYHFKDIAYKHGKRVKT